MPAASGAQLTGIQPSGRLTVTALGSTKPPAPFKGPAAQNAQAVS